MEEGNFLNIENLDFKNADEVIEFLTREYYKYNPNMERITVIILITKNLRESYEKISPDIKDLASKESLDSLDSYNGLMVLPMKLDESIHILLNANKIMEYSKDKTMTWLGTFAHELTHAIDFYQIARKDSLESYMPLRGGNQYYLFTLWSEYHARKIGYSFLRKLLVDDEDNNTRNERLSNILNKELPFHLKMFHKQYNETSDGRKQIYITMQFIGRYSVWENLFPETFNSETFSLIFKDETWMYHIYSFMKEHETLDLISNSFENMRAILRENWKTI